jgi:hypothetical protein
MRYQVAGYAKEKPLVITRAESVVRSVTSDLSSAIDKMTGIRAYLNRQTLEDEPK